MKLYHNIGLAMVALSLATTLFAEQEYTFQPGNPVTGSSILLKQSGRSLRLYVKRPTHPPIKIIPLDPPPLSHDMKIKGLKRIEIIQAGGTASNPIEYAVTLDRL